MRRLLALFHRNLLEDNRRVLPYVARTFVLGWLGMFMMQTQKLLAFSSAPGREMFIGLVSMNLFFLAVFALSNGSSVVTEEREERTLGLLLMTGMNAFTLLFGKGLSRAVSISLLLLIQTPIFLLAISLGGVSPVQISSALFCLFASTFLVLNLAILVSVMARRTRNAASITVLLLVGGLAVTTLFWETDHFFEFLETRFEVDVDTSAMQSLSEFFSFIGNQNPIKAVADISDRGFTGPVFSQQVIGNTLFGAGYFLLAIVLFPLFAQRTADSPGRKLPNSRKGSVPGRKSMFKPGRPNHRPVIWKDFYFLGGGKQLGWIKLVVLPVVAVFLTWLVSFLTDEDAGNEFWEFVPYCLIWFVCIGFVGELLRNLGRLFRTELDQNTLTSLFSLPIPAKTIVRHKLIGANLSLTPYLILGIGLLVFHPNLNEAFEWMFETLVDEPYYMITGTLLAIQILVLSAVVYLRFSLTSRWGALPATLFLYPFCLQIIMGIIGALLHKVPVLMMIVFNGTIASFLFILWNELNSRLLTLASQGAPNG